MRPRLPTRWLREFRLIFGASTAASAAVLAIFIGGLGAGGVMLGSRADRHARPIRLYAQLEAIVALSAAVSPLLLFLVRTLYIAAGGTPRLGLVGGTAGRLVLSALVLAVPTVAMGGTLPAVAGGVTRQSDVGRRDVAILYGLNALGAVVGCLVATFFLLEHLGTRATLWIAAGINLLVAMAASRVDRTMPAWPVAKARIAPVVVAVLPVCPAGARIVSAHRLRHRRLRILSDGAGVVSHAGAAARRLHFHLRLDSGGRPGGDWRRRALVLADLGRSCRIALAICLSCLLEAAALAGVYALGDRLAVLTLTLRPLASLGFETAVLCWTLVTMVVVLPAAIVAGYQFPLLIALFGRGRTDVGRQVGLAYAANTLGAIGGRAGRRVRPAPVAVGARRVAIRRGAAGCAWRLRDEAVLGSERATPGHHLSRGSAGGRGVRDCRPGRGRSNRRLASQRHRRGAGDGDSRVLEPVPRLGSRAAACDCVGRGRHRKQRGPGGRAQRLRLHRQREVRRQRPRRCRHTGDARVARRHPESGGAPLAGDRPRHRQLRRLAGRSSRHGSGRRRRARAADRRCGASVRRGQPRGAAKPQGPPDDWRCARNAADRARGLRHHRIGAVESVPRRRGEPLHA